MKYAILIGKTNNGYSAYAPDLPGCVAAGDTRAEVEERIRAAIVLHIESLREYGEPTPEPQTTAALIEVQPLGTRCRARKKSRRARGEGKMTAQITTQSTETTIDERTDAER